MLENHVQHPVVIPSFPSLLLAGYRRPIPKAAAAPPHHNHQPASLACLISSALPPPPFHLHKPHPPKTVKIRYATQDAALRPRPVFPPLYTSPPPRQPRSIVDYSPRAAAGSGPESPRRVRSPPPSAVMSNPPGSPSTGYMDQMASALSSAASYMRLPALASTVCSPCSV